MSAVCPSGHASATTDYCDQCGAPLGEVAPPQSPPRPSSVVEEVHTSPAVRRAPCPACGVARSGDDRFCEGCGRDFDAPQNASGALAPQRPSTADWTAVASADRARSERQASVEVRFPDEYPERCYPLEQAQVRIGRSRARPGEAGPEIDLAGVPEDPGISRLHAVLERQPDGSYSVRDLSSTNGTFLNDLPTPIGAGVNVPLKDGDRVRVGAWTTLTLRRR